MRKRRIFIACSRVVLSLSAVYFGRASDAPCHVDLVYGRAPKTASWGSWETYVFFSEGEIGRIAMHAPLNVEEYMQNVVYGVRYWPCSVCDFFRV